MFLLLGFQRMCYARPRPPTIHPEKHHGSMQIPVGQSTKQLDSSTALLRSPEMHCVARLHRTARFGAASPLFAPGGWRLEPQVALYVPCCVDEWISEPLGRWHAFAPVAPPIVSRPSSLPVEIHVFLSAVCLGSSWLLVSSPWGRTAR